MQDAPLESLDNDDALDSLSQDDPALEDFGLVGELDLSGAPMDMTDSELAALSPGGTEVGVAQPPDPSPKPAVDVESADLPYARLGTGMLLQSVAIASGFLYLHLLPVAVLIVGVIGAEPSAKLAVLTVIIPFFMLSLVVFGSTLYLCTPPIQLLSVVAALLFGLHLLLGLGGVSVAAFGHRDMDIVALLLSLSAILFPLGCLFAVKSWGRVVAQSKKRAWRKVFEEQAGTLMALFPAVSGLNLAIIAVLLVAKGNGRALASVLGIGLVAVVVGIWRNGGPVLRTAIDVGRTYRRKSK